MSLKIVDDGIVDKSREYISFSEIYLFYQCPWKHHVQYNLGIKDPGGFYSIFGSAIHEAIEQKWKYKNDLAWLRLGKIIYLISKLESEGGIFPPNSDQGKTPKEWVRSAFRIYNDFFIWINKEYPDCELFDIEYEIKEPLDNFDRYFKGFIDLILYDRKNDIYHIMDLKTSSWGWGRDTVSDTHKLYQVILYKKFFCKKENIDPKKVQCHYVLLLRNPPKKAELAVTIHSVTSGEKKIQNSMEWVEQNLTTLKRGIRLKTPSTCNFCNCGARINKWAIKK